MAIRHLIHTGGAECIAAHDINRDFWPDIAWTDWNGGKVWYARNNRDGTWSPEVAASGLPWAREIHFADIYQDGRGGLLVAAMGKSQPEGGFYFIRRNLDGSWTKQLLWQVSYGAADIIAADLDGDGKPDIVTAEQGVGGAAGWIRFYQNTGGGNFVLRHERTSIIDPTGLAVTDLGRDGLRTVIVTDSNGAWYYKLNFWGSLDGPFPIARGIGPVGSVKLADLDNDGIVDLILAGSSAAGLRTVRGDALDQPVLIDLDQPVLIDPHPWYYTAAADLNHDGLLDIAAVSLGPDHVVAIFWQGPTGVWTKETVDSGNNEGGRGVCIADWLRNGRPHPIVSSYSAGTVVRWEI